MMSAMKEMQQRTGEEEGVRQQSENMLPVFRVKQIGCDQGCRYGGQEPCALVCEVHNVMRLSRSELPITLTDDRAIAAAAMIGESSRPNSG